MKTPKFCSSNQKKLQLLGKKQRSDKLLLCTKKHDFGQNLSSF